MSDAFRVHEFGCLFLKQAFHTFVTLQQLKARINNKANDNPQTLMFGESQSDDLPPSWKP